MQEVLDIFAVSNDALWRIVERPKWFTPLIVCIVVFFLLAWLTGCWRDLSQALSWSNILGPALISPLIVGIVSLSTTALVYSMTMILGGEETRFTKFRSLYSVNIHCGVIFLLGEIVNFLLIRTNILGEYTPPLRGRFPVGLDLLLVRVDEPSLYLSIILHSTSVFLIWYLVVLSLGITAATGLSRKRSIIIVTTLWCATVGLMLGLVYAAGGQTTIRIRM